MNELDRVLAHPATGQPLTIGGVPVTGRIVMDRLGGHCGLCQEPASVMGAFTPHEHTKKRFVANTMEMGFSPVRDGKERIAFYALCAPCFALPDRNDRVEALFLGRGQQSIIET